MGRPRELAHNYFQVYPPMCVIPNIDQPLDKSRPPAPCVFLIARGRKQDFAAGLDLDLNSVSRQRLGVDLDAETWRVG
jgi:hypothetical protein